MVIPKSTTNEAANPAARDAMLSQLNPALLFDAQYVFCSLSTHESMYNYEVISEFDGCGGDRYGNTTGKAKECCRPMWEWML